MIRSIQLALRAGAHFCYRVRAAGLEHVPKSGPALLVANHVSYADSLVLAALLDRPVRFLVWHRLYERPGLRWFFDLVRAIPVASASEDPARLERAMREAVRTLRDGELLGVFPEGQLTRTGEVGPFRPGVERILAEAPAPVVPIALRGLWGSVWSHGPRSRLPAPRRRRVEVEVAPALPPEGLTAARLEQVVRGLRGAAR